jgi:hypothetical protein
MRQAVTLHHNDNQGVARQKAERNAEVRGSGDIRPFDGEHLKLASPHFIDGLAMASQLLHLRRMPTKPVCHASQRTVESDGRFESHHTMGHLAQNVSGEKP